MDRRSFIKTMAVGGAAMGLSSCVPAVDGAKQTGEVQGNVQMRQDGDIAVGLLGFGCMRWPIVSDENGNGIIDQESVNAMVDKALAHGINYFDSSPVYLRGMSEEATAKALARHPRESYLIATKLSVWDGDRQKCIEMYRRSLEIYGTDHIDYYLLHSMRDAEGFRKRLVDNGVWDFLRREKKAGHIRRLGFSFHGTKEGFDSLMALHGECHWDFVQIQMNYCDWKHAEKEVSADYMYSELEERGIPVIVMEPLLGGRLADVPAPVADMLKSKEPGSSPASWAFRFCGSFPGVLCILSGMNCMEHLEDNIETFCNFRPLKDADMSMMEKVADRIAHFPTVKCTACDYCMPCPYGIDIPKIFTFYNKHITSGTYVATSDQKNYAKLRRKYLIDYNRSVATVRQADHCIGCEKCIPKCPQRIKIPRELRRIDDYIEVLKREKI